LKKRLNPSIGPTRALMRRWSCSTTLFKYGLVRMNGGLPTVIEFVVHAMRRRAAWVGSKPSQGNHPRVAVATERLTEEGFGGGDVAGEGKIRLWRPGRAAEPPDIKAHRTRGRLWYTKR
jgi:hypothetical protein